MTTGTPGVGTAERTIPVRALFVGPLPPRPGGASVSLGQLVAGIAAAGVEVCAVAPITAASMLEEGDWYAARHGKLRVLRYLTPAYHSETYKPMPGDVAAAQDVEVPRLVRELAVTFRPDLLIAGFEHVGYLVRPLAQELGLPWCQLLRGWPTGQILADDILPPEQASFFLDLYRSADRVIAVARYMADGLERRFGIRGVRTIPNAIDLDAFAPRPRPAATAAGLAIPDGVRIVLVPASLIGRKRPLDVLRAAERVLRVDPAVVFVLAGSGVLRDEIVAFAREHGFLDRLRLPGLLPYTEMPALYDLADLVVMASEGEGMARAYVEAMASGRALVASDIAAARELIEDGRNGVLFPLGDDQALAERILELLADPARLRALGRRARASVADRRIEHAVAAYVREIKALVEEVRPAQHTSAQCCSA